MASEHNDALDGLRGVAILAVILLHGDLVGCGWVGVQLFFVISGYLITTNLLRSRRYRLGPYLKDFYYRRLVRIFPVYFAYLAFLGILFVVAGEPAELARSWPYLVTYTYNLTRLRSVFGYSPWFAHFWSLCVEEQFYLVWPFVVHLLPRRGLRGVVVAAIALGPVVRALTARALHGAMDDAAIAHAIYWFTPAQADSLAIGAAIAVFDLAARVTNPVPLLRLTAGVTALLGACNLAWTTEDAGTAIGWRTLTTLGYPRNTLAHGVHVWGYSALGATFGALVLVALKRDRRLAFLSHPRLVHLGRVSYTAYVVHCGVIVVARRALAGAGWYAVPASALEDLAVVVITLALTWLIASASYRRFERPLLAGRARYQPGPGDEARA